MDGYDKNVNFIFEFYEFIIYLYVIDKNLRKRCIFVCFFVCLSFIYICVGKFVFFFLVWKK